MKIRLMVLALCLAMLAGALLVLGPLGPRTALPTPVLASDPATGGGGGGGG